LKKSAVQSSNRMLCSENLLLLALVSSCCCLQSLSARRFGPQPASFRALSRPAQSGVSSALRSQLGQLASPLPGGVVCPTCLLVAPQASSRLVQGSVARQELQQAIRSRGLPQEVANRLAALAFARSVSFHTFSFTVSALVGRGHYETFVGAGRRLDDVSVEFGIVHSVATAQLVAKTTPVPMRSCKRRWLIRRCRSWTQQVPRGLTAEELRQVEAGLRHFAIAAAASRVAASSGMLRSRRSAEEVASDAPRHRRWWKNCSWGFRRPQAQRLQPRRTAATPRWWSWSEPDSTAWPFPLPARLCAASQSPWQPPSPPCSPARSGCRSLSPGLSESP
ncbi:hypothetical protein BOX15_Mlig031296g2, partial [Macrostomum lignano]